MVELTGLLHESVDNSDVNAAAVDPLTTRLKDIYAGHGEVRHRFHLTPGCPAHSIAPTPTTT